MLDAFTASLFLITISELGDKTFCIAMLLAMRHSRRLVFIGVASALVAMTVLSVLLGQVISLLPKIYIVYAEVILFVGFGLKLLYDAYRMKSHGACEVVEAQKAITQLKFQPPGFKANYGRVLQFFTLTFVAEWGDRTQFATIALAASKSPVGVTLGAIAGHLVCTAIAVLGGRMVAGRISERTVTAIGGALFILFGVLAAFQVG